MRGVLVHSFEVLDATPESFVRTVTQALAERGLEAHVSVRFLDGEIVARISWLGTTELRYRTRSVGSGFLAQLERQRVAALHAAFQGRFEERFEDVLTAVGARLV
jgi:hypothetical protein